MSAPDRPLSPIGNHRPRSRAQILKVSGNSYGPLAQLNAAPEELDVADFKINAERSSGVEVTEACGEGAWTADIAGNHGWKARLIQPPFQIVDSAMVDADMMQSQFPIGRNFVCVEGRAFPTAQQFDLLMIAVAQGRLDGHLRQRDSTFSPCRQANARMNELTGPEVAQSLDCRRHVPGDDSVLMGKNQIEGLQEPAVHQLNQVRTAERVKDQEVRTGREIVSHGFGQPWVGIEKRSQ